LAPGSRISSQTCYASTKANSSGEALSSDFSAPFYNEIDSPILGDKLLTRFLKTKQKITKQFPKIDRTKRLDLVT
jgi:hypothetical protein